MYTPPFNITPEIFRLAAEIAEHAGAISVKMSGKLPSPMLRKNNNIKTIHSSLAIENNTLSLQQVTDIVDGKHVFGSPDEIQEVKNAIEAYKLMLKLDAFSEKDLLKAHGLMMQHLVKRAGKYRAGGVGVFDSQKCVHLAPPAERVPMLMGDLFEWVSTTDTHPLISSCVFHYEFEFIHPFEDGNGRMGRFWQTLLLSRWKKLFAWLPVETIVKVNQQEYYKMIAQADASGDSTCFVEFMLRCLLSAIKNADYSTAEVPNKIPNKVPNNLRSKYPDVVSIAWEILELVVGNPYITAQEISARLGISDRMVRKHLATLKSLGIISREGGRKKGFWSINLSSPDA